MSDFDYDRLREEGRQRARSTAVWNPGQCTKEYWDYEMARIPHDAIGADQTKHAPHNSYGPKFWYQDEWFQCKDCAVAEKWTAQSQQWWYEAAKGPIYSRAVRCRSCRKAFREKTGKISHSERQ